MTTTDPGNATSPQVRGLSVGAPPGTRTPNPRIKSRAGLGQDASLRTVGRWDVDGSAGRKPVQSGPESLDRSALNTF